MKSIEKESKNIKQEKINALKKIIPECFSEGALNIEKFKTVFDEKIDHDDEQYNFTWKGKKSSIINRQTRSKGTLIPNRDESINFDRTGNLFIESDNLEAMKLLQKSYYEKIKMIYIDPPYNLNGDFVYNDNLYQSIESYLEQTGQTKNGKLLTTEPETVGRIHSNWLTMMYPRLSLAKNLLREDGVIIISIDDHEFHNLVMIMNEIFGEDNFIGDIIWNSTKSVTNTALVSVSHTYNLIYAKSKSYFIENRDKFKHPETGDGFSNPDDDPRGAWKADPYQVGGIRPDQLYEIKNPKTGRIYTPNSGCSWKNSHMNFKNLLKNGRIIFGAAGTAGPQRKRFLSEAMRQGRVTTTLWKDIGTTASATKSLKSLFGHNIFNNPKPTDLIKLFLELGAPNDNDIVLDFFAGSGTTGAAIFDQNLKDGKMRKFILIQIPEKIKNTTQNAEALTFLTKIKKPHNIAEISKERLRRVIPKLNTDHLGFKVFKLEKSNYKIWEDNNIENNLELKKQLKIFESSLIENYKDENVIYECIIKEGYDLNSKIKKYGKIKSNKIFYVCDNNDSFYISLDIKIKTQTINSLSNIKDEKIVFFCLDGALTDSQKTNLAKQCTLKTM